MISNLFWRAVTHAGRCEERIRVAIEGPSLRLFAFGVVFSMPAAGAVGPREGRLPRPRESAKLPAVAGRLPPTASPMSDARLATRLARPADLTLALLLVAGTAFPAATPPAATPAGALEAARAFHRGDYARAKALAEERLKRAPADVAARILAARADAALGRFDAAFDGFRAALKRDPENPDALYYLGVTASVLAQVEYDRLLATAPDSARAHQLKAQTAEAQGRKAEAQAEYEAALAAGPPTYDVLVALGDLRRGSQALDEAASYYERALLLAPSSYDALYGLATCRSFERRHSEAVDLLRRALAVDPRSASARLALGISLVQTGQAEAAIPELQEAARLEPRMRQAHYQLGRAYQSLGRADDAQAAFAKAQELLQQEREADAAGTPAPADPSPVPQP
jgi:tetratricopeptide (TPR) repeat protein